MHRKDVERYDELNSKLISLKGDIALLSAKKPNETVNEFKLKLINKMLAQINDLIKDTRSLASNLSNTVESVCKSNAASRFWINSRLNK